MQWWRYCQDLLFPLESPADVLQGWDETSHFAHNYLLTHVLQTPAQGWDLSRPLRLLSTTSSASTALTPCSRSWLAPGSILCITITMPMAMSWRGRILCPTGALNNLHFNDIKKNKKKHRQGDQLPDNFGIDWVSGVYGSSAIAHPQGAWQIYQHSGNRTFLEKSYEFYKDLYWARIDGNHWFYAYDSGRLQTNDDCFMFLFSFMS